MILPSGYSHPVCFEKAREMVRKQSLGRDPVLEVPSQHISVFLQDILFGAEV